MSDPIRFHLDEHIAPEIAHALRRRGVDVTTTIQTALRTTKDPQQVAFAQSQQRVIVTDDRRLIGWGRANANHPGMVLANSRKHSTGEIIEGLTLIYKLLKPEEMAGRVEYI